jgi:hypothetical protein
MVKAAGAGLTCIRRARSLTGEEFLVLVTSVGNALRSFRAATLDQLAVELNAPRAQVEAALSFWVHRGDAAECTRVNGRACGTSCRRCPVGRSQSHADVPPEVTVYEWVSRRADSDNPAPV